MTLEELVGQKLVLGIEEARLSPQMVELFRQTHAGGLILFRRNFESPGILRQLISGLEQSLGRRLLVMVDHEGGRVIHLGGEGVTVFPDARALGISGCTEYARRQGEIEALELLRLGIDLNLAPVLDVLTSQWNPAIGTRSYGEDPERVAEMGSARIQGMQSKGLSACAKHYPGLGEAVQDPHGELPVIHKSWKQMKETDLLPFRKAFEAGVEAVMSSHPAYPELDSRNGPATFSKKIITEYLRYELGFSGLTLTDDLKMGALSKKASPGEAALLAAKAGHDLLLICSDPKAQREAFDRLLWAYKKKELRDSELEENVERINKLKTKRSERFGGIPVGEEKGEELARSIAKGGAQVLGNGKGLLPLSPALCLRQSLGAFFPDLSPVARERFIEPGLLEPEAFLKKSFSQFGVALETIEKIPLRPDDGEKAGIVERAGGRDLVFFFCWDAHLFPELRGLLKKLEERVGRLVVILLREPQDARWVQAAACVSAYGFRTCQIEAAIDKMFSGN